jgi:hypothetical protein
LNFEDRVTAVAKLGFTERQARFLTTVMLHAGICVPRQYARFAGIAYGHKVNHFFDKLIERRYATVSACRHNRAALYHVRHHALYTAIGQPDSRYRRPVSAQLAIERLMRLDGVLTSSDLIWLGDEAERVAFFALVAPSLPRQRLPHAVVGKGTSARVRLFPEQLPIGVSPTGRAFFLFPAMPPFEDRIRVFVQHHHDVLRAVPGWTLRLLVPPHPKCPSTWFETIARTELTQRFAPTTIDELNWYFRQCRDMPNLRARSRIDERFWQAQKAFSTPHCRVLYQRWLIDGDDAFDSVSSTAIEDALTSGNGRIESVVLPFSYRHLSPLGNLERSATMRVEEGDKASARPQPPSGVVASVSDEGDRNSLPAAS